MHSNGLITNPINTDDVGTVIGDSSHDVATLCTNEDKINPDALFRPRYSANNPGLQLRGSNGKFLAGANAEIAAAISQRPAQGTWGCPACGIWVPEFDLRNITSSNYSTMQSLANQTWFVPVPDKDGNASFKILDHFDGYDHNAKIKVPLISVSVAPRTGGGNTIKMQLSTPSPLNQPNTISVSNLFGTDSGASKRWYFGAVVFRGTNNEGITPSDAMIVFSSGTAIKSDDTTTVTITKDDTSASASTVYYYRIVPFVCDNANITSATDTTFYGIRMNDKYLGMIELKVGESATGGILKDYYLAWTDVASSRRYPMPDSTVVTITPSTYHPDVGIVFRARPEGKGTGPLKDLYSRVEMTFSRYVNGVLEQITYVWRKTGVLQDDNVLKRDTQKDNTGGFEDYLFFTIDSASFLQGVNDLSEIEMAADFYYNDGTADYGLLGTFIPEDSI